MLITVPKEFIGIIKGQAGSRSSWKAEAKPGFLWKDTGYSGTEAPAHGRVGFTSPEAGSISVFVSDNAISLPKWQGGRDNYGYTSAGG